MSGRKRTKQQKIIARLRRQIQLDSLSSNTEKKENKGKAVVENRKKESIIYNPEKINNHPESKILFSYDPKLIKKGFLRTGITCLFFLSLIFSMKLFFRL